MKNTFGNNISLTLFGESHGEAIGTILDGLAPGIPVDEDEIAKYLTLRRPAGTISTARAESDKFRIVSGVFEGFTTGTPICIIIPNTDTRSCDYSKTASIVRPGHADYTAECKYHGYQDYRGGGHFSGRLTAPIVAAGAILLSALRAKGIRIGTHIASCAGIRDRSFDESNAERELDLLDGKHFALLDSSLEEKMVSEILSAKADLDSVGGVLETLVIGTPAGVGEPWFDSVESMLSHALFSIPAVKGVEFGAGFSLADMRGSQANDSFYMSGGRVVTETNNNGGINGGITNGMPIRFKTAIKPTPSIAGRQNTVNIANGENDILELVGRHDPAIVHRARVVVDAVTALVLADMLVGRYGTDWLGSDKNKREL